jgi:hypothetical protein
MSKRDLSPDLVREALAETLAESLGAEAAPPALRSRLLSAATTGPMRHAPFFDELARLFDLGVDAVVRILENAGNESSWEPGPHPALRLVHLEPGPSLAAADAGFVRMPASFDWPSHRHTGVERVLILEGGYRESGGRVYRAGDTHEMGPNTEHSFTVLPDSPLLLALVLHGEIQML